MTRKEFLKVLATVGTLSVDEDRPQPHSLSRFDRNLPASKEGDKTK